MFKKSDLLAATLRYRLIIIHEKAIALYPANLK